LSAASRALWLAVLAAVATASSCSLLVGDDVARVRCSESGRIGPPACDIGEICAGGRCQSCATREVCGDGVDNDCDARVDDACAADSGEGGAAHFSAPDASAG